LMQSYIDGFNLMDSFTLTESNEIQYAWLLLLTQSFRSMRCALLTMYIGYYGEAMSLLRIAVEDWLAAEDCQKTPRTIEALLHNKQLQLNWGNIAQSVNARKIVYEGDYKHLSRFTHVSKLSLAVLRDPDINDLRIRPAYDEVLFLSCCEMLIRNAIRMAPFMLSFLSKQADPNLAGSWSKAVELRIQQAGDWLREQQKKYGKKGIISPNNAD